MKKLTSLLLVIVMLCTCMGAMNVTALEYGRLFPAEAVRKSGSGGTAEKGVDWYREDWETLTTYKGISTGVELLPGNWITLVLNNDKIKAGTYGAGYYTLEAKVANGDLESTTELTLDTSSGYTVKWPIGYTGAWNGVGFNPDGTRNNSAVWFTEESAYLRDGENTLTITNTGESKFVLYCVDFALTARSSEGGSGATGTTVITTEAENYTDASGAAASGDTVTVDNDDVLSYDVNITEVGTYEMIMNGLARMDVTTVISVDGKSDIETTLEYHSETAEAKELKVAEFDLMPGTYTISFAFYCPEYFFDSFVLKNIGTDETPIDDFTAAVTPVQAYEVMTRVGDMFGLDVEGDIEGIAIPEMAFARFAGRNFLSYNEFITYYDMVIETEKTEPTAAVYNAAGTLVNTLPTGDGKIIIDGKYIKKDMWMTGAVYSGNKLCAVGVFKTDGNNKEIPLKDLTAGSNVKFMFFEDMKDIKPIPMTDIVVTPHPDDDEDDEVAAEEEPYMEIYVSSTGRDRNTGLTSDDPVSISKAITLVESNNADMTGDIIVNIAPGTYAVSSAITITDTASGKNGYNVIFRAQDPENKPVISGGAKVTGWTQVAGKPYWVADTTATDSRSLYVNGYQATLARTKYLYRSSGYIVPASPKTSAHITDGLIVPKTNFPSGLEGETDMGVVFNLAFVNHRIPLASVTYDARNAYLNADYPRYHSIPLYMNTTIAPSFDKPFYLENAKALMDEPGEFYVDKTNKKVYYYPYEQEDMTTAETYLAKTQGLLSIAGNGSKAKNIKFEGISFRYGADNATTETGASFFQTDNKRLSAASYYGDFMYTQQITLNCADRIVFDSCEFTCLGSSAVGIIEGVTNSRITGSSFHDISGTGVVVGSFEHNNNFVGERSRNIEVDNNIFRRCAQEYLGLTAIACYYAGGVDIHHNDIKDMPYSGIVMGWGWGHNVAQCRDNRIAYNRIEKVMQILEDGAHIYTLGVMPNTQICDNYLIDPGNYRRNGIYLDSASGSLSIFDNVVTDITSAGDCWFFGRAGVGITNVWLGYNHTDGGTYSMDSKIVQVNNSTNVTEWSTAARKIMANAGPVDKSEVASIDYYPAWRRMRMNDVATAEFVKSNENNVWRAAADYDRLSGNPQIYDGCLGSTAKGNYFEYDFNVPVSGNYRVLVAGGGSSAEGRPQLRLYIDGSNKQTATLRTHNTLYTHDMVEFSPQYMTAGTHRIRIYLVDLPVELACVKIENMDIVETNDSNYDDGIIK